MTKNERVREVRKSLGLTLEKFGERVGVKKNAISAIENGRNSLTEQMSRTICLEFNVNPSWLTTGNGEMFIENDNDVMERIDRIMTGENEFHKKLIKWCAVSLDDDDLNFLEKKIDSIIAEFSKDGKEKD